MEDDPNCIYLRKNIGALSTANIISILRSINYIYKNLLELFEFAGLILDKIYLGLY